jgi:hypothetical protein
MTGGYGPARGGQMCRTDRSAGPGVTKMPPVDARLVRDVKGLLLSAPASGEAAPGGSHDLLRGRPGDP